MTEQTTVIIGRIGKPHGVRGEVTVEVRTDEPDRRFAAGAVLGIEGSRRTLTVADHRWHQGRLLVTFAESTSRDGAEELRGSVLSASVAHDELPEEEDAYYDRQLVGLAAHDRRGRLLGRVESVVHLPAQDLLEVRTDAGLRLVPFVAALVPEVDLAAGTVTITAIDGLLEDEDEDEEAGAPEDRDA